MKTRFGVLGLSALLFCFADCHKTAAPAKPEIPSVNQATERPLPESEAVELSQETLGKTIGRLQRGHSVRMPLWIDHLEVGIWVEAQNGEDILYTRITPADLKGENPPQLIHTEPKGSPISLPPACERERSPECAVMRYLVACQRDPRGMFAVTRAKDGICFLRSAYEATPLMTRFIGTECRDNQRVASAAIDTFN